MKKEKKLYQIVVFTSVEDVIYYTESEHEDIISENEHFKTYGSAKLEVSFYSAMVETFDIWLTPEKVGLIQIREVERSVNSVS